MMQEKQQQANAKAPMRDSLYMFGTAHDQSIKSITLQNVENSEEEDEDEDNEVEKQEEEKPWEQKKSTEEAL